MRGQQGRWSKPQGLALRFRQMNLKSFRNREISERKQVGDAEDMLSGGVVGDQGLFRGEGGEV